MGKPRLSAVGGGTAIWVLPGLRTPFVKSGGRFTSFDAIALSVPVVKAMMAQIHPTVPDFAIWGTVAPDLGWSNIAREVFLDAAVGATVPAFSTIMVIATPSPLGSGGKGTDGDRLGRQSNRQHLRRRR